MLDIGWQELFLIAVVTLVVVGPKELPKALRAASKVYRRARGLAREFQSGFDDMMREAELNEIRAQVNKVTRTNLADTVRQELDPVGELTEDFDPRLATRASANPVAPAAAARAGDDGAPAAVPAEKAVDGAASAGPDGSAVAAAAPTSAATGPRSDPTLP